MNKRITAAMVPLVLTMLIAGCSGGNDANTNAAETQEKAPAEGKATGKGEAAPEGEGLITLNAQQIKRAGIETVRVGSSGGGSLTLPATIEGDPQGTQIIAAAIGGRVVTLNRNLGDSVARGQVIAVIESREAASLRAEVEAARARASLAQSNLQREQRLFNQRVSPERDVIAARSAATEANIAVRLAQQQLSAAGVGGGALNRIGIVAPISGRITARPVTLGQSVAADAELFRVSNLSRVSVSIALSPDDAARVRVGTPIEISAGGRRSTARLSFVSPVLDDVTRLVPAIAVIDNRQGLWRVGEGVSAILTLPGESQGALSVPASAIQTVEGRDTVFIRTPSGFRAQAVTLGARSAGNVAITAGLTGNEDVATTGSFTLKAELAKGEAEHGGH